jgi:hypothetical protein
MAILKSVVIDCVIVLRVVAPDHNLFLRATKKNQSGFRFSASSKIGIELGQKLKKMNFWLKLLLSASALFGCFEVCSGECFTTNERGPKTQCVFPFIQSGKTYTKCTTDGDEENKFWHQ